MSIKINLSVTLEDDFISDVLICAFDGQYGGSWYWAAPHCIEGRQSYLEVLKDENGEKVQPTQWVACHIMVDEENGGELPGKPTWDALVKNGTKVDAETIRVGIQYAVDNRNMAVIQAVAEADAGHIDADAADVIVQYGLFGEVVYG